MFLIIYSRIKGWQIFFLSFYWVLIEDNQPLKTLLYYAYIFQWCTINNRHGNDMPAAVFILSIIHVIK